jgi:hypothetical protein
MTILLIISAFLFGCYVGCRAMHRHLFAWLVMKKMEAAAEAIQPVVELENEFASGARMAAKAIFAEFGIGYKDGGE